MMMQKMNIGQDESSSSIEAGKDSIEYSSINGTEVKLFKNRSKWFSISFCFVFVLVLLIVVVLFKPSSRNDMNNNKLIDAINGQDDYSPSVITKEREEVVPKNDNMDNDNNDDDDNNNNVKEGEDEFIPPEGVDCKNRRHEHPGTLQGPKLQFIHVPKAGGTSIQQAMFNWATHDVHPMIFNGPFYQGSMTKCPSQVHLSSILMGHRGFGYCRDVIREQKKPLFTFAVFREPVSRMISLYDFNLKVLREPRVQQIFGWAPLDHLVKHFNSTPEIEEGERLLRYSGTQQARFICGFECLDSHKSNLTDDEILARAKVNLYKLDVVGVTEHLVKVIAQLRFQTTIVPSDFVHWPNDNHILPGKKSHLDPQAREIFREWARLDEEIYNEAVKIFEKKRDQVEQCTKKRI